METGENSKEGDLKDEKSSVKGCVCGSSELWDFEGSSTYDALTTIQQGLSDYHGPTDYVTLTRHILTQQRMVKGATGELTQLLNAVQVAAKAISYAVRKAGITNLFGIQGVTNIQGEAQKKLDKLSNDLMINIIKSSFSTCIMVTEENENIVEVEPERCGPYIICFDPLDGSSNIECLVTIGTIFGIYRKLDDEPSSPQHALQPGKNLVAAGYALYGSATLLVLSIGNGVDIFMLDPSVGEFLLIENNVKIPPRGEIYSINEAYELKYDPSITEYVKSKKDPSKGKTYASRYVGSMVADVHRTIKYGGIYLYPANTDYPEGKIRLLYECNPMAFIVTQAGGLATNGKINILDIIPEHIHQRSAIFLGSKEDVMELQEVIDKYKTI